MEQAINIPAVVKQLPRKVTKEQIDAKIIDVTYTVLPSGKCMVCEIVLENGFTVRGESACVVKEEFDYEIGKEYSYKAAYDKIWQLEGYLLQEDRYRANCEPVIVVTEQVTGSEGLYDWLKQWSAPLEQIQHMEPVQVDHSILNIIPVTCGIDLGSGSPSPAATLRNINVQ